MKTTKFEGEAGSAYGKKLETAIRFNGTFEKLEKEDVSLKDALLKTKEWPTDEDIIEGYINPRRLAAAKAKAQTEAFDAAGIKKPAADAPEVQYKNLFRQMKIAKYNDEQANKMVRNILAGVEGIAELPDLTS